MARVKKKTGTNKLLILASLACDQSNDIDTCSADDVNYNELSSCSSSTSSTLIVRRGSKPDKRDEIKAGSACDQNGPKASPPKEIHLHHPVAIQSRRHHNCYVQLNHRRHMPFKKRSYPRPVPVAVGLMADDDDFEYDNDNENYRNKNNDYRVHTIDIAITVGKRQKKEGNKTLYRTIQPTLKASCNPTAGCKIDSGTLVGLLKPELHRSNCYDGNHSTKNNDSNYSSCNKKNANGNNNNANKVIADEDLIVENKDGEDESVPTLVNSNEDGGSQEKWEKVQRPLPLPSYLPSPTVALRSVQSISLKIQE